MVDGGEQLGVEPGQPSQGFGVRAVAFARVVVDGPQLTSVGDKDLVVELLDELAGPAGMRADFQGDARGRQAVELALQRRFRGWQAGFFDQIALRIDDREVGKLVPQIEANEKRAMLRHGSVLSSLHLRVRESLGPSYEDEARYRRRTGLLIPFSLERTQPQRGLDFE